VISSVTAPEAPAPRRLRVAREQGGLGRRVQAGGRFVEHDQQRSLAHQAAGQRESLPLAAGELASAREAVADPRREPLRQPGDRLFGARLPQRGPAVGRYIPHSNLTSVVLPAPFSPTIATVAPEGSSRSISWSVGRSARG
jgi:hypothetical protein